MTLRLENIANVSSSPSWYRTVMLTCLTIALALVVAGMVTICLRLAVPHQRFLIRRSIRPDGTYYVPHNQVVSSILIISFGIGLAIFIPRAMVIVEHPEYSGQVVAGTVILPFPLFAWIYFHALAVVYAAHLTPPATDDAGWATRKVWWRLRSKWLNLVGWSTVVIIICIQLCFAVIAATTFLDTIKEIILCRVLVQDGDFKSAALVAKRGNAHLATASLFHRLLWVNWGVAFFMVGIVHIIYTRILIQTLNGHVKSIKDCTGQAYAKLKPFGKNADQEADARIPALGPARKTLYFQLMSTIWLVKAETFLLGMYSLGWIALSIFKVVRNFEVLSTSDQLFVMLASQMMWSDGVSSFIIFLMVTRSLSSFNLSKRVLPNAQLSAHNLSGADTLLSFASVCKKRSTRESSGCAASDLESQPIRIALPGRSPPLAGPSNYPGFSPTTRPSPVMVEVSDSRPSPQITQPLTMDETIPVSTSDLQSTVIVAPSSAMLPATPRPAIPSAFSSSTSTCSTNLSSIPISASWGVPIEWGVGSTTRLQPLLPGWMMPWAAVEVSVDNTTPTREVGQPQPQPPLPTSSITYPTASTTRHERHPHFRIRRDLAMEHRPSITSLPSLPEEP